MKKPEYQQWLDAQKYQANTITAQLHRASRVEECYGDLDEHFRTDRLASVIAALAYSKEDKIKNLPNPTKIPFKGDAYSNLASYRDAVKRYQRFRIDEGDAVVSIGPPSDSRPSEESESGQRIGLERDMQAALRRRIDQLEEGLRITDDGAERSVESGFIDITASDTAGSVVVIELKTGVAGQRAVAQILSYMGDIAAEQDRTSVRGILVAAEFDAKAKAAARVVPTLTLRKYSVHFKFSDGNDERES